MSLRDTIKAANDLTKETIEIPEWDVKLEVRSMSARARATLLNATVKPNGTMDYKDLYSSLVIGCCFDPESGERVFNDSDADWLSEKNAGPQERIATVAMRLSGITQDALEQGKDDS